MRPTAAVVAVLSTGNAKLKAHVAAVEAGLHRRVVARIQSRHAIHEGVGKGWSLGSLPTIVAGKATRQVEDHSHGVAIEDRLHRGGVSRVQHVHAIDDEVRERRARAAIVSVAALLSLAAVIATWNAKREAHTRAVKTRLHRGGITGIQGAHAIHDEARDGRGACAILPARNAKREPHVRAIPAHAGLRGITGIQRVHAIHDCASDARSIAAVLAGRSGGDGVDEAFEAVELAAHLVGIDLRAGLGEGGVVGHEVEGAERR